MGINRRSFLFYFPLLAVGGCVSANKFSSLEDKINLLYEKEIEDALAIAEKTEANSMYWRNALTGGGSALDGVTGMSTGDGSIVLATDGSDPNLYFFVYDASASVTEDSPNIIVPDSGGGAWNLCDVYTKSLNTTASDGHHFVDAANASSFSGAPADGYCHYNKQDDTWCCYDGSQWECATLL